MDVSTRNKLIIKYHDEYGKDLYTLALSQLRNSELAREAVQETFLRATESFESFYDAKNRVGWLFSVLKSVIYGQYKDRRNTALLIELLKKADNDSYKDEHSVFNSLKGTIDDESLKMLIMIYCYEYTYLDVAKYFDLSLSACKSRIKRAKEQLKKYLKHK